ncbi:MAG: hypothetical protein MO846_11740 [Candidatus Devosia symbiotica]|nr:hypothetical protein [Candidatus Devosia symbiotica]
MLTPALYFIGFVGLQRLSELALVRRNTVCLLAGSAREIGAGHYPTIVALHASWLLAIAVWGFNQPVSLPWPRGLCHVAGVCVWILASLGPH